VQSRESVGNSVVVASLAIPVEHPMSFQLQGPLKRTTNVPLRIDELGKGKKSEVPELCYVLYLPKRSPDKMYKIDKLYVGLLREVPPPKNIQEKWDRDIVENLEKHLCQATATLPKAMRDEDVITELVLCMAGERCSTTAVVLDSDAKCPKSPIALRPTVWIHCGSKKCMKKVVECILKLPYLNHFLSKFHMGPPHISLHAPWPAASETPPHSTSLVGSDIPAFVSNHRRSQPSLDSVTDQPQASSFVRDTREIEGISLAIRCIPFQDMTPICGARIRFAIVTSDGRVIERYSTVGGIVKVRGSLFGLTTAHGITSGLREMSSKTNVDEDEDDLSDDSSSERGLDCQESSGSNSDSEASDNYPSHSQSGASSSARAELTVRRDLVSEETWLELPLPQTVAYGAKGTTRLDYSFPDGAPDEADFALIDMNSIQGVMNGFHDPIKNINIPILQYYQTSELIGGEVLIVTACGSAPAKGYLLEAKSSVIVKGRIIHTKKIQIDFGAGT
jgi:hypothetical protein